ncbi:MAG: hypothetical protein GF308_03620 [Candidatus Heimdallarchaeota archaeon]|nr:hypothetical protein [Candidatus Heimdallarchaeota archaeon]
MKDDIMDSFQAYLKELQRGNYKEAQRILLEQREPFCFPEAKEQWMPTRPFIILGLKLDWKFDLKNELIVCKNNLTIRSIVSDLITVKLHAVNQEFKQIVDEKGNKLDYHQQPEEQSLSISLAKPLEEGEELTLFFDYQVSKPRAGGYFILPNEAFPDVEPQFWTQFQDDYARYLVPIFDHPGTKIQTTEIILTVPKGYRAISNGLLKAHKTNDDDNTETYHWLQEKPMPAYLITVAIGKFEKYVEKVDDLEVIFYAEKKWDKKTVYRSFGKTPAMIKFFNEKLGVKYPWAKYGQVAVSNFIMGGMENISVTTQTDRTFHDEKTHKDYTSDGLVSHELAHQWGGDLITCKSWTHAWLNEGWATQMQNEWKKHDLGEDEYLYEQLGKKEAYFKEDKKEYRRPLVQRKWEAGVDVFDRHLYPGGAWRYYMLKHFVGEEIWWEALGYFLTKYSFDVVETIDLQRAFEDITGNAFDWYFDQWLYKAGYPEVKIKYSYDEKIKQIHLRLEQTQEEEQTPEVFRFPLTIEITTESDEKKRFISEVKERIHEFYFPLGKPPKMIEIDPDFTVLWDATIEKPEGMWLEQLVNGQNIIMRIQAVKALAKKNTPKAIKALGEVLLNKTEFWGVQAEIAKVLGTNKTTLALEQLLKAITIQNSKARTAVAEALGNFYQDDKAVEALKKLLDDKDSYFVVSAAANALGKTKHESALQILAERLPKVTPGWEGIVVRGYLQGLAATEKKEAIDHILPYLKPGKYDAIRNSVPPLLAKLGKRYKKERPEIKELLEKTLLTDKSFRVSYACVSAIASYEDASLIPALNKYHGMATEGHYKRGAKVAIRKLKKKKEETELKSLSKSVEELEKENRELKERIAKIEAQLKEEEK